MANPYANPNDPLPDDLVGLDEPLMSAGRRYAAPAWAPRALDPYVEDPGHHPGETMLFASDPVTGPRMVGDAWAAPPPPMPADASQVTGEGGAGPGGMPGETYEEEQYRRTGVDIAAAGASPAEWQERYYGVPASEYGAPPRAAPGAAPPPPAPRPGGGGGGARVAAAPGPAELPEELRPEYGGLYYPADYEQRVWKHLGVESGADLASLSPQQLDIANRALEGFRAYQDGPVGLAMRERNLRGELDQMALDQQRRQLELEQQEHAAMAELRARQMAAERKATESAQIRLVAAQEAAKQHEQRIADADKAVRDFRIDTGLDPVSGSLAIVAEALGSLGAGLAKMPNTAHNIIENAIGRKVAAQRAELEKRERGAGKARNDLEVYWKRFGDMEQAQDALTARYLREFADQAALVGNQTQSQRAQAALADFEAYGRKNAELRDVEQRRILAEMWMAQRAGGGGGARSSKAPLVPGTLEYRVTGAEAKDMRERWLPGLGVFVDSAGSKKVVADKLQQYRALKERTATMRKILSQVGHGMTWDQARAQLEAAGAQALSIQSLTLGQGVVTESDPLRNTIPDPADWLKTDAQAQAAINTIDALADRDAAGLKEIYGVEPGTMEERVENGKSVYYVRKRPVSGEIAHERERAAEEAAGTAGAEPAAGGANATRAQRVAREIQAEGR